MLDLDGYRDRWKDWQSRGPVAPFDAAYHRTPHPEFVALCAEADRAGLHVMLDVSEQLFGLEPLEFRLLGPLIVGIPERPQLIVEVIARNGLGKSLPEACRDARRQLASIRPRSTEEKKPDA